MQFPINSFALLNSNQNHFFRHFRRIFVLNSLFHFSPNISLWRHFLNCLEKSFFPPANKQPCLSDQFKKVIMLIFKQAKKGPSFIFHRLLTRSTISGSATVKLLSGICAASLSPLTSGFSSLSSLTRSTMACHKSLEKGPILN